ncbi:hypothetical protein V9T40_009307 [Parthenolecanium corni]|uniref:NEDD8-activating enzyme E1 regulatory subunit n=1 Tax=Parthenolecanium corni TaxID=536013 RepID=A0AAN9Y7D8_9HEMI
MDSNSPKSPEQSEKTKKYDRQLRLWGDHGQFALETAHVCLINATGLGTEILKSIILPGIGSFTVIDGGKVREDDISVNFFLDENDIGKSKAEAVTRFLLELNPDVHGDFIDESLQRIIENNPSFFNSFNVVVGTALSELEIILLSSKLWELKVPLLICRSYGFIGMARLQIKEHTIVESHPDNQNTSYRLLNPFPELKTYLESFDLDSLELKDLAHVPFVVILYKYLQEYRKLFGRIPKTYKEKETLRDLIRKGMKKDENGLPSAEENFEEAIKAVNYVLTSDEVPKEIVKLLTDDNCVNLTTKSTSFWIMANALKYFVEKEGYLPVRGVLPDMTAETKHYVKLQQIYRSQALRDSESVYRRVQQLLQQLNQSADSISEADVKEFCKFSHDLRIVRSSCISHEYLEKPFNSSYIVSNLDDPDSSMEYYVILRSIERFYSEYKEYPGNLDDHVEPDIVKLKACVSKLLSEIGSNSIIKDDLIHEFCRYGGVELHSVSSFLGGCIAQEVIKLLTHQFIPINNTIIYNAVSSDIVTFCL